MHSKSISLVFTLIIAQFIPRALCKGNTSYVNDACRGTTYPDICVRSLASYSDRARQSPTIWARAGVLVSINKAKNMSTYLINIKTNEPIRGRNKAALLDCIECFDDLIYHLENAFGVLRKLNKQEFFDQIDDVTTWVSSALTDEDTCLDGFGNRTGKRINVLCNKVTNVSYITSNALALVNKLANSGPQSLSP